MNNMNNEMPHGEKVLNNFLKNYISRKEKKEQKDDDVTQVKFDFENISEWSFDVFRLDSLLNGQLFFFITKLQKVFLNLYY